MGLVCNLPCASLPAMACCLLSCKIILLTARRWRGRRCRLRHLWWRWWWHWLRQKCFYNVVIVAYFINVDVETARLLPSDAQQPWHNPHGKNSLMTRHCKGILCLIDYFVANTHGKPLQQMQTKLLTATRLTGRTHCLSLSTDFAAWAPQKQTKQTNMLCSRAHPKSH